MQITIGFTCRDCGRNETIIRDTANLPEPGPGTLLRCAGCGHTSARLFISHHSAQPKQERRP